MRELDFGNGIACVNGSKKSLIVENLYDISDSLRLILDRDSGENLFGNERVGGDDSVEFVLGEIVAQKLT